MTIFSQIKVLPSTCSELRLASYCHTIIHFHHSRNLCSNAQKTVLSIQAYTSSISQAWSTLVSLVFDTLPGSLCIWKADSRENAIPISICALQTQLSLEGNIYIEWHMLGEHVCLLKNKYIRFSVQLHNVFFLHLRNALWKVIVEGRRFWLFNCMLRFQHFWGILCYIDLVM